MNGFKKRRLLQKPVFQSINSITFNTKDSVAFSGQRNYKEHRKVKQKFSFCEVLLRRFNL